MGGRLGADVHLPVSVFVRRVPRWLRTATRVPATHPDVRGRDPRCRDRAGPDSARRQAANAGRHAAGARIARSERQPQVLPETRTTQSHRTEDCKALPSHQRVIRRTRSCNDDRRMIARFAWSRHHAISISKLSCMMVPCVPSPGLHFYRILFFKAHGGQDGQESEEGKEGKESQEEKEVTPPTSAIPTAIRAYERLNDCCGCLASFSRLP